MAISGSWAAGAVTPSAYAGATKWGTGINPVHAIRDEGAGRGPTKEPLGSVTGAGVVGDDVTDPFLYGFTDDDAQFYAGEDYRYLETDHAGWGADSAGRPDRGPGIMTAGTEPGPAGFPSWGPAYAEPDSGFPLAGGPPGGAELRAQSEGTDIEALRAIAVPSRGLTGGWLNKAHGEVTEAVTSDPSQYEMTTSMTQLHKTRVNDAAVTRATDDPRAPIQTRLTGQKVKSYAASAGMGGGPGSPDMAPVTQDLPFRPWYFRKAALPPPPDTTYGTMTAVEPLERTPPMDAGEMVTQTETGMDVTLADVSADQDYYA